MRTRWILSLVLLSACVGRQLSEIEPEQSIEQVLDIPLVGTHDVDILFVIDDSGSMAQEQASLAANFDRFMDVLTNAAGGMPSLHLGVVSTDMGVGSAGAIAGCSATGDGGRLQGAPRVAGCSAPAGAFISDVASRDGTRQTNYQGSLADTFGCIAQLGIDGCGFEQPLEAARRALDGSNPQNAGFLRQDAFLALVFITDEDDCSATPELFDTSQNSPDDPLGPLSSFRCFDLGVVCDPDTPREPGVKTGCAPREDSPYFHHVRDYVDFFRSLKADPEMVIVAGIIGDPSPVVVGGAMDLMPSCETSTGSATPAIRMSAFLDGFPGRSTETTICDEDLSEALALVAEGFEPLQPTRCVDAALAEPIQCEVADVVNFGLEDQLEVPLPHCDRADGAAATNQPCWLLSDSALCAGTASGLALDVFPEERAVSAGTHLVARCLVE